MYCPECSQQVSGEVRFCPRCGLQLDAVRALLAGSQTGAGAAEASSRVSIGPTRKRDVLLGATVMLAVALSVVLLTVSAVAGTPLQAVLIPLLLTWVAVASVTLLSGHAAREVRRLFSKDASAPPPAAGADLVTRVSTAARRRELPHARSTPASGLGAWRIDTAELAQPPSVTERTTELLGKEEA